MKVRLAPHFRKFENKKRLIYSGALIEKKVVAQTLFEPVWIGWNEQTAGLASGWWRDMSTVTTSGVNLSRTWQEVKGSDDAGCYYYS